MKQEESLHIAICDYLKMQYPDVIFTSEASGIKLTIGQAVKLKRMRSGSKLPDIWILEPKGNFHGLFLEVKAESPFRRDGSIKAGHFAEQEDYLSKLRQKGYSAMFVWSFDHAKAAIDNYMSITKF